MNIEQAIDILKNSIADYVIGEYCEKCADNKICDDRAEDCYYQQAIDIVVTAYEKEKNKELYNPSDMILRYYDNGKGMQVEIKGFISKDKIREIIYPTPENYIPVEVQQSDMYKKLVKEVEE